MTTDTNRSLLQRPPAAESLFKAAELVDTAVATARADAAWAKQARAAIRAATLAVEHRLDDFSGPEGYAEDIAAEEPRLLPELERLEETIARLLVESWSVKPDEAQPTPDFLSRLLRLATEMRRVASLEFDLVHEAMNKPGGVD
jgi:hypothetical protein